MIFAMEAQKYSLQIIFGASKLLKKSLNFVYSQQHEPCSPCSFNAIQTVLLVMTVFAVVVISYPVFPI